MCVPTGSSNTAAAARGTGAAIRRTIVRPTTATPATINTPIKITAACNPRIQSLPFPAEPRYLYPMNDPEAASWSVVAGPEAAGVRLDRFLTDAIGTLSRSRIKALIEDGHAAADGAPRRDPADAVRPGVRYTVDSPQPRAATPQPQDIALHILHEDADLIVIDKPAGLVVHPAPGNEDGTLVNALLAHCGEGLTGIGGGAPPRDRPPAR